MVRLSIRKDINGSLNNVVESLTDKLKTIGFGVLTRIDFDKKIKEKLNKEIDPTVVLGACNPQLVYEVYQQNPQVTLLIPCNVVIRQNTPQNCRVEIVRPTQLVNFLEGVDVKDLAQKAEDDLTKMLNEL